MHLLTFAAEIAGDTLPSDAVKAPLVALLSHPNRVVREGAIYGLARHADDPAVREQLVAMSLDDESPGVRLAATETVMENSDGQ